MFERSEICKFENDPLEETSKVTETNISRFSSGGRQRPRLNKEAEEIAIAHCTQCLHHLQVAVGATRRANRSHLLLQNLCSRRHPPLSSSDRPPQLATRKELLVQAGSLHQVSRLHLLGLPERSIL